MMRPHAEVLLRCHIVFSRPGVVSGGSTNFVITDKVIPLVMIILSFFRNANARLKLGKLQWISNLNRN